MPSRKSSCFRRALPSSMKERRETPAMSSFLAISMFTVTFLAPIVVLARVVVVRLVARCGQFPPSHIRVRP